MPQMMPMYWLLISIFIIMAFIMVISFIYSIASPSFSSLSKLLSYNNLFNKWNWKW